MPAPKLTYPTQRLEFLSDGVYAIALTLLTIDVVSATKTFDPAVSLVDQLLHQWPVILAYPIGFATIMVVWVNHHRVFHFVRRADSGLMWLNGLILLLVAGTPIPTALLAEHVPGPDEGLPLALYLSTFVLMPVLFWLLWFYAERRGLIDAEQDPHGHPGMARMYLWAALWDAIALAMAYLSVWVSLAMLGVAFALLAFPVEVSRGIARVMLRHRAATEQPGA